MSAKLSNVFAYLSRAQALGVLITFAVLSCVGYAPVVGTWFLADDFSIISKVTLPRGGNDWGRVLSDFHGAWMGNQQGWFYRPIGTLLFALDYFLYGANPFGYHLTNLTLHIVSSFCVYLTALELVEGDRKCGVAYASGALFALYPNHPDAVTWIAGRMDVACAMFYFLALFFFLRWLRTQRRVNLVSALSFFILSLLCKEMALTLPGLLFVCALFKKRRFVDALVGAAPFALILGGYLLFRHYYLDIGLQNKFQDINNLVLLPGFVYETLQAFVPINFLLLPGAGSQLAYYALPLILLAPMAGGFFLLIRNDRSSLFFLLFLLVLYAVSVTPIFQTLIPDPSLSRSRYLYIPSAFLSMFIAYAIWAVAPRGRMWRLATILAVCGAFLALLLVNNSVWVRASEISESLQGSQKAPEHLPLRYKGVPVLLGKGQVRHSHEPPFAAPTDPP